VVVKRPVIICANPVFGDQGLSSTEEIARELSKLRPVLFVNFPLTIQQLISEKTRAKNVNKTTLVEGYEQLWVYEPPIMFPSNALRGFAYTFLSFLNNLRYYRGVRSAIHKRQWENVELVNAFNPMFSSAFFKLRASNRTYYCYDNIAASHWMKNHGSRLEAQMVPLVDRIIVSSQGLKEKFSHAAAPVVLIPNGMNSANFEVQEALPTGAIKIAYVGALDDRIDYGLLSQILELPLVSEFKIAGPIKCNEAKKISNHNKVSYLGIVPKARVGEVLEDVNLGIIPFVKNDFTKYIYPLKINEYLSKGLAVLSTDFADLSDFKEYVRPVSGIREAEKELLRILSEELIEEQKNRRHQFALKNTWANRANDFDSALDG